MNSGLSLDTYPFCNVFEILEKGLIAEGSRNLEEEKLRAALDIYKTYAQRPLDDEACFEILVFVIFYSGFRAATVTERRQVIRGYFASLAQAAAYSDADIQTILADENMIRNASKIKACVENARTMLAIIAHWGSFKAWLDSFEPTKSFENLFLLKESLEARFAYLGGITVYHFMMDLGLPLLKPDRVICRTFFRLGLLEDPNQLFKTVLLGRKFAEATGLPIRYIDIVFVAYGQVQSKDFGIEQGICTVKPRCEACVLASDCVYFRQQTAPEHKALSC